MNDRYDLVRQELSQLRFKVDEIKAIYEKRFNKQTISYLTHRFYSRSTNIYSIQRWFYEILEPLEPTHEKLMLHPYLQIFREIIQKSAVSHKLNNAWIVEPFYIYSAYLHTSVIYEHLLQYYAQEEEQVTIATIEWFSRVLYGSSNSNEQQEQELVVPHLLRIKENVNPWGAYPNANLLISPE